MDTGKFELEQEGDEDVYDGPPSEESGSDDPNESTSDSEDEEDGPNDLTPLNSAIEKGIEGDFERLVQDVRAADPSSSTSGTVLSKVWDFHDDEDFQNDLKIATGIGRPRKSRQRQQGPPLSQQVRSLIGDGNQAYVDNDLPAAISAMQEVIRIEPRAVPAWSVLAQCYEDMGQPDRAVQLRIMAAHLRHDAEEWERLAKASTELGHAQQALYCYGKLVQLDPSNVDALWDRANLAKNLGDLKTAKNAFQAILKRFPHDIAVLSELRVILIELNELQMCTDLYQYAFDHYFATYPAGHVDLALDSNIDPTLAVDGAKAPPFALMEVLVLADLYNTLGEYGKAIRAIKKGLRWLQGRAGQIYWDDVVDDREYDYPDSDLISRREGEVRSGLYPLDVNARHRLAVARIKLGDVIEGKMHAQPVLSQDPVDYSPLFLEIADSYFAMGVFALARPVYETLGSDASTSSIYVLMQTAACFRMTDDMFEAAEIYEHVRSADPSNNEAKMKLAEIYEILNEPKKALDLVCEVIESRKKTKEASSNDNTKQSPGQSLLDNKSSLFAEGISGRSSKRNQQTSKKLSQAELEELEAGKEKEVQLGWKRLNELWGTVITSQRPAQDSQSDIDISMAIREWMVEAGKLVDAFRETKALFGGGKAYFRGMFPNKKKKQSEQEADEDRMVSRLHLDLERRITEHQFRAKPGEKPVVVFRGVHFDDWLRVFVQYSFLLTERDKYEEADEMLRHVLSSNAFSSSESRDTIRLALLTCAIHAEQYLAVIEHARHFAFTNQFSNEPLRLLQASLTSGLRSTDAFVNNALQKFLFREMRMSDFAVRKPEGVKYVRNRWTTTRGYLGRDSVKQDNEGGLEEDAEEQDKDAGDGTPEKKTPLPKKQNPYIYTLYGQVCVAVRSYQSAIFYLLHAYDYCQDDPMICLCLAVASVGRAMQRQADNRHHLVTQGMAFLSKYRNLRGIHDAAVAEVDYNFGRTFHQLGLLTLAVKHYENVLKAAETKGCHELDCSREAAYNLSLIYAMTGANHLAEQLYRKWLTI